MTILKNANYNVFLKESIYLVSTLIVSLLPWLEFINSNYDEIDEIFNDNFSILICLYLLAISFIYFFIKFLFKNRSKIYYISVSGISIWIFFQFNLIKVSLNNIFNGTYIWHFLSEISLGIILIAIISSFYFLSKKINLNFFVLFFLIFNFVFLSATLIPKIKNFYDDDKIKKNKMESIEFNSNIKNRPNIYFFISDAMKPLNEFEDFYKIKLENFRDDYQKYGYEYYKDTSNTYKWTELVMTGLFYLEENIYTLESQNLKKEDRKLKPSINKTFPALLKKDYQSELLRELSALNYKFKWVGNYMANCSHINYRYCLENKRENYIDLYTLQAFLNKSPLIQIFDNLIQLKFVRNYFDLNILHSDAFWEIDNFITSNKNYINDMGPTFFFIHDMETHEPYFVDSNCNYKRFPGSYNLDGYKNSYLCVIKQISKLIKTIDKFDSDSIVIFQSDHSWRMSARSESKYGNRNSIFSLIKNNKICKKSIPNNPNNLNTIKYFIDCLKDQKI